MSEAIRIARKLRSGARAFFADAEGLAAVELALILPIMLMLMSLVVFGGQAYGVQRRVTLAATTVANSSGSASPPTVGGSAAVSTLISSDPTPARTTDRSHVYRSSSHKLGINNENSFVSATLRDHPVDSGRPASGTVHVLGEPVSHPFGFDTRQRRSGDRHAPSMDVDPVADASGKRSSRSMPRSPW